jgi:hypothetical protein
MLARSPVPISPPARGLGDRHSHSHDHRHESVELPVEDD